MSETWHPLVRALDDRIRAMPLDGPPPETMAVDRETFYAIEQWSIGYHNGYATVGPLGGIWFRGIQIIDASDPPVAYTRKERA